MDIENEFFLITVNHFPLWLPKLASDIHAHAKQIRLNVYDTLRLHYYKRFHISATPLMKITCELHYRTTCLTICFRPYIAISLPLFFFKSFSFSLYTFLTLDLEEHVDETEDEWYDGEGAGGAGGSGIRDRPSCSTGGGVGDSSTGDTG